MEELIKLKEMLCDELKEYGEKGELTTGSLEVVDKLAHSIKNIDKVIDHYMEEDGYSGNYPYAYGTRMIGGSYRGGMGGSYRGGSYARGRGRNARRDSMGRYSSESGYSRAEDDMQSVIEDLRGMMGELPDEKRREVERFISKVEQM